MLSTGQARPCAGPGVVVRYGPARRETLGTAARRRGGRRLGIDGGAGRGAMVRDPLDDPNPSMFLDPARRLDCAEREVAAARYHHDLPAEAVEWAARVQERERG